MKKLFALLASLRLAVILLCLLLVGLSAGTIVETRAGAEAAGRLVYYAWWFLGLQGLFALNLAMSLADLFPWNRKRVGFVLTHASLLLIFAGAAITYFAKVEGSIALWEGQSGAVVELSAPQGQHGGHHELPFTITLDDFVLDVYPGTMRPAGFASQVRITDRDTGRSFPARIWMNHELRHRGYALFQSSYQQGDGREATVLSVSRDPGQVIVFAGYAALIAGMIVVLFTRFGQAREAAAKALLALLVLSSAALAASVPAVESLRRMPVQHDGRTMPLDTLAREQIWIITGSHGWQGQDPAATVAGWIAQPREAATAALVQVGSSDLVKAIGLPPGTRHAAFMDLVQNQAFLKLRREVHLAEMQDKPRKGLLAEAEGLERRLRAMQGLILTEGILPIPVSGDVKAKWQGVEGNPVAAYAGLMAGPRLEGWPSAADMDREVFYNRLNPVRWSWIVLLGSLGFCVAGWMRRSRILDGVAFVLLLGGFGFMTWGIQLRWAAGGRIPAANMYESLLFLAWGVGLFAVVAYAFIRNRVVVLNAAFMAALTMALTDLLPIDRFIHPIAPVLAGTPWLAIHVPIIMVGYAVLALGLVVAHMQIGAALFAPRDLELPDRLYDLLYNYMFIGNILLITGIITGSVWAASSWGRYWGWDPKEVWSLVAFLAYMAILHAKLDRRIGKFGVAAVSIVAFQTILMTYLGVNFVLATGMHSYGMGDSPVVKWMLLAALAETVFLVAATVAHRRNLSAAN